MSDSTTPQKVTFCCEYCQKNIQISPDLPTTTAPCPYCGLDVTSPDFLRKGTSVFQSHKPDRAAAYNVIKDPTADVAIDEEQSGGHKLSKLSNFLVLVLLLLMAGLMFYLAEQAGYLAMGNGQQKENDLMSQGLDGNTEAGRGLDVKDADDSIWKPIVGDSNIYKVVVEVPRERQIMHNYIGQRTEVLEQKVRATYIQASVYRGLKSVTNGSGDAHVFDILNGGELEEVQYMGIDHDVIHMIGSKKEGESPRPLVQLSEPMPLVRLDWEAGDVLPFSMHHEVAGKKVPYTRQFRILGWEQVETEAGSFRTMHVQVVGESGPIQIRRDYWFAPGTGFIKDVKKYFSADSVIYDEPIYREAKELLKIDKL